MIKIDFDTQTLFQGLSGREGFYFLDSCGQGRYSFMGFDPVAWDVDVIDGMSVAPPTRDFFCGGLVGVQTYEGGRRFGLFNKTIVFDHEAGDVWWIHIAAPFDEAPVADISTFFVGYDDRFDSHGVTPVWSIVQYRDAFESIQRAIYEGEIYQANLTQRFDVGYDGNVAALYWQLRAVSPAPFGVFMRGADGRVICSVSPERFFSICGDEILAQPIKGTRIIGQEVALMASEKDAAELVMITDLLRNDLGRVCEPGSVSVVADRELHRFAQVAHTQSTIRGRLRIGWSYDEVFSAVCPGGSITGAPKKRAVEILAACEACKRDVYTGALGYIGFGGHVADFNIAIRTVYGDSEMLHFHGGGGIVADSVCEAEYQESLDKVVAIQDLLST